MDQANAEGGAWRPVPLDGKLDGSNWGQRKLTIVVPAKNEAKNIGTVLARLPNFVDEIIVVDGNSTDNTREVVKSVAPDAIIVNDDEPGKGNALRRGFAEASGDDIVMLDADNSMDPSEIFRFVVLLAAGYDLVKGSRFMAGGGSTDITPVRRLGNWALRVTANRLFGTSYTDLCYGYVGFRREILDDLNLDAKGFEIEAQLILRSERRGYSVTEVPSYEFDRTYGDSNLHAFRDGIRILRSVLRERRRDRGNGQARTVTPDTIVVDLTDRALDLREGETSEGGVPLEAGHG